MKKLLLVTLLSVLVLTGCSADPYADISDRDQAVVTIDNNSYTRGQFYDALVTSNSTVLVTNKLVSMVYENIIGDDEAINEQVTTIIDELKGSDNTYFQLYLSYMGYADEEAYAKDMTLFLKQDALVEKYLEDNYDQLFTQYKPKMVRMLQTSDSDNADTALALIKDGADFAATTVAYGNANYTGVPQLIHNKSTNVSSNVLLAIQSYNEATILDAVVVNSEGTLFNVIEITDVDSDSLKEAFIAELKQDQSVMKTALASFIRAGNFTVFDKIVFDALTSSNPEFLNQ